MKSGRNAAFLAAVLALVVPLGCAGLPSAGEVHEFPIEAPGREPLRQFGAAPQEGSSPQQLLNDFLRAASAGAYDDFATARLYLTPGASMEWKPSSQVIVFPSASPPKVSSENEGGSEGANPNETKLSVSVETVGTVDQTGVLSTAANTGATNTSFTLTRGTDGEWRISELADGLILSQSSFLGAYQQANLYFPSEDLQVLVPDPRWYPRARIATHLVQGLIEGPSVLIQGAVAGGLAANLSLPASSVEVKDRVALVSLDGESSTELAEREALQWSIGTTLRQLSSVQTVQIKLNGVDLEESPSISGPDYRLDRVTGIKDGAVVVGSSSVSSVVAAAEIAGEGARWPTVGPLRSSPVAWVDPDSGRLGIARSETGVPVLEPLIESVEGPGSPSVDRHGQTWLTSAAYPFSVLTFNLEGQMQEIKLPLEGTAKQVVISPDGARAALLIGTGDLTSVVVAAVHRDADTGSISLMEPEVLSQFSPQVLDLTWVGETTVAGLAQEEDQQAFVEVQSLGGWMQTMAAPEGVERITASSMVGSIIVQRADGGAFQKAGAAWIELADELQFLSFAG